ncbi:hypothetical protein QQ008_11470 [Fulvivirgaceae bacterium BMA10]|uniref:Uncharacterized protein n=1 Tax=Splendidivirga corallicola TaxID=3051826 RepID=A0ABT8KR65_9BACT|nr:hypothetical protein [Fulvivirgaceae bacterium BMA10]
MEDTMDMYMWGVFTLALIYLAYRTHKTRKGKVRKFSILISLGVALGLIISSAVIGYFLF